MLILELYLIIVAFAYSLSTMSCFYAFYGLWMQLIQFHIKENGDGGLKHWSRMQIFAIISVLALGLGALFYFFTFTCLAFTNYQNYESGYHVTIFVTLHHAAYFFYSVSTAFLLFFLIDKVRTTFKHTFYALSRTTLNTLIAVAIGDVILHTIGEFLDLLETSQSWVIILAHLFTVWFLIGQLCVIVIISSLFSSKLLELAVLMRRHTIDFTNLKLENRNNNININTNMYDNNDNDNIFVGSSNTPRGSIDSNISGVSGVSGISSGLGSSLTSWAKNSTANGAINKSKYGVLGKLSQLSQLSPLNKLSRQNSRISNHHGEEVNIDDLISKRQEQLFQIISKQNLLTFVFSMSITIWSTVYGIVLLSRKVGDDDVDDTLYLLTGKYNISYNLTFHTIDAIYNIPFALCIWFSFKFASNEYNCVCSKCHSWCLSYYKQKAIETIIHENSQRKNDDIQLQTLDYQKHDHDTNYPPDTKLTPLLGR